MACLITVSSFERLGAEPGPYQIHRFRLDETGQIFPENAVNSWSHDDLVINAPVDRVFVEGWDALGEWKEVGTAPDLPDTSHYLIDQWTTKRGLPHNHVRELLQTRDGYLWIGTTGGLARFDGLRFEHYNQQTEPAMATSGDNVLSLAETAGGALWIGTSDGLIHWAHGEMRTIPDLAGVRVEDLLVDHDQRLWVAGKDSKLFRQSRSDLTFAPVPLPEGYVSNDRLRKLWQRKDQTILIGGIDLLSWHPDRPEVVAFLSTNNRGVYDLVEDTAGTTWIGTSNSGVIAVSPGAGRHISLTGRHPEKIQALAMDQTGTLFASTARRGLYTRGPEDQTFAPLRVPADLGDVSRIMPDADGNLWLGTRRDGLFRLRQSRVNTFRLKEPFGFRDVNAIAKAPDQSVWIATATGFVQWSGRDIAVYSTNDLWGGAMRAIWFEKEGARINLLGGAVSTLPLHPSQARDFTVDYRSFKIDTEEIQCVYRQPSDPSVWWMGTEDKGAIRWSGLDQYGVIVEPELEGVTVRSFAEDMDESLWIATHGHGLKRWTGDGIEGFTTDDGLAHNACNGLWLDDDGALWVATEGGLSLRDGEHFYSFSAEQGLPHDEVKCVMGDDQNRLWLGSPVGIYRIFKDDFRRVASGQLNRLRAVVYDHHDGMRTVGAGRGYLGDVCKMHDGTLWFATDDGVAIIDPRDHQDIVHPPSVFIEGVVANGRNVTSEGRGHLVIPPGGAAALSLRFTAIDLTNAAKLPFQYRLEGFDTEWRIGGPSRQVTYTNLPPDSYRFHVQAANHHGFWNRKGAQLMLTIRPHYYQTLWFKIVLVLVFLSGLVALAYQRLRRQRLLLASEKQRALRSQRDAIANDMHDLLGAPLTSALLSAETESTHERIRETIHTLQQFIWTTTPANDDLESLLDYLADLAQKNLSMSECKIRYQWPKKIPARHVSSEIRLHLTAAIQEALHNIVKHARAKGVLFAASLEPPMNPTQLLLVLRDDGVGFDPGNVVFGLGLASMTERLTSLGGHVDIHAEPGDGATLTFHCPLSNPMDQG